MNITLLIATIERILSRRYGKTATVRIGNASKSEEDESAGRSEAYKGSEGG